MILCFYITLRSLIIFYQLRRNFVTKNTLIFDYCTVIINSVMFENSKKTDKSNPWFQLV